METCSAKPRPADGQIEAFRRHVTIILHQIKLSLQHSQIEKILHAVAMKRLLALNRRSKESKHNLEIPDLNRIRDPLHPIAEKQRLCLLYRHRWWSYFLTKGEGETMWYMK
jgi:hypothetical protein